MLVDWFKFSASEGRPAVAEKVQLVGKTRKCLLLMYCTRGSTLPMLRLFFAAAAAAAAAGC